MRGDRRTRRNGRRTRGTSRGTLAGLGALTALAAFAACNSTASDGPVEGPGEEQLVLEGRLTDEGVECPALRSEDETLYTLTGDLRGFGPGDRVRIVARPVQMSFCMQGTTVEVLEISALE